jgi:subtilisin family serine protease
VRIFPADGGAQWQDYTTALDQCVYSERDSTKVVVMSLGGQVISPGEAEELENRIGTIRNTFGINVVVAAGNGGGETDFPGRFPASFTVAAVDGAGALCGFSARGAGIDLAAPGCGLEQAGWDGSPWTFGGTSYAAPIVAGALAAIRSYRPDLTPDQAEEKLRDTARPGPFPRLDASAALRAIGRGDIVDRYRPYTPPPLTPAAAATPPAPPAPGPAAPPALGLGSGDAAARAAGSSSTSRSKAPRAARLRTPRLRVGRVSGGRVLVRATNRPRGALLELRIGATRMTREGAKARVKVGRARQITARYVTELSASRWVRVTIRRR